MFACGYVCVCVLYVFMHLCFCFFKYLYVKHFERPLFEMVQCKYNLNCIELNVKKITFMPV